jgi:antitoxin component YwqK of YwqJK toxin-antitoxin module
MKGHFENDKRDGIWRLFDEDGKLILRRRYDKGEVTSQK